MRPRETHCVYCGKALKGMQRRFCSERCKRGHRVGGYWKAKNSLAEMKAEAQVKLFQVLFDRRAIEYGCTTRAFLDALDESRNAVVVNPEALVLWAAGHKAQPNRRGAEVA